VQNDRIVSAIALVKVNDAFFDIIQEKQRTVLLIIKYEWNALKKEKRSAWSRRSKKLNSRGGKRRRKDGTSHAIPCRFLSLVRTAMMKFCYAHCNCHGAIYAVFLAILYDVLPWRAIAMVKFVL